LLAALEEEKGNGVWYNNGTTFWYFPALKRACKFVWQKAFAGFTLPYDSASFGK
jgi:hypothetical protein